MKTKLKNILVILMLFITIMQVNITSLAELKINQKVNLKSNGMLDCLLQYYKDNISDWSYKIAYYIYYVDAETGKKIPAICVEPSREGVGESGSYSASIDICKDNGIYTIMYLYNTKKYTEWGIQSKEDYYLAVQTAMHCYSDNVNPKTKYRVGDRVLGGYTPESLDEIKTRGKAVLNTAESLYNSAKNKKYKPQILTITLNEKGGWTEEKINGKTFYTQKYALESNAKLEYYTVEYSSFYKNAKLFDLKNKELKKDKVTENNFKIAVLKSDITNAKTIQGNIKIKSATAKLPTVLYANSADKTKQNYVVYEDIAQEATTSKSIKLTTKNTKAIINKIDSETKLKLEGAIFDIYKEKKDNEGNYILNKENHILTTEASNSKGEILLPIKNAGKYVAVEKKAPNEYSLSQEIVPFSIEVGLKENAKKVVVGNDKIRGKIEILKISKDDNKLVNIKAGTPLNGAKYLIEDADGNEIGTYTTDSKGKILTGELPYGEYKIYEIESPKYYNVNTEPQTVFINKQNEVYRVVFENESSKVDLEIKKFGTKETESGKQIEYEFDDLKNKSNVYVDNFTWKDTLPTEAVRLTKISTGTWTDEVKYSIWYKTNLNGKYVMYKKELNSKQNYTFKMDELKLSKDEYITEYEFRFGTVPPGFKEDKNPKIKCKVLKGLKNGYEFTNKTYLTATYFEQKIQVKDKCKTIIYNKETTTPKKLPKTGF